MTIVRRILIPAGLALLLVLGFGQPVVTQSALSTVLLQSDLSANTAQRSVTVWRGATDLSVGDVIVSGGEAMTVSAISGTTITVNRAALGTSAVAHGIGDVAYAGAASSFASADVTPGADCSGASMTPSIYPSSGRIFSCLGGVWVESTRNALAQVGIVPSRLVDLNTTLTTSTTQTCVTDDQGQDLWSYTLRANTLNADGRGLRIKAWGSTNANDNLKSVKLMLGGFVLADRGNSADNDLFWRLTAEVIRTGATTWKSLGEMLVIDDSTSSGLEIEVRQLNGSVTAWAAEKAIHVFGDGAAANDLCLEGAIVETIR